MPVCGVQRSFRVQHAYQVLTLFFIPIPVVSFLHRYFETWDVCGHSQPMEVGEVDELARIGGVTEQGASPGGRVALRWPAGGSRKQAVAAGCQS